MSDFSAKLKKMMFLRQVDQVQLAKNSGINQSLISKYLREERSPTLKTLIALANALHCSLETLTGLESLKGIEKEAESVGDLSAEEKAVIEAYNSLTDGEKKAIDELLLKRKEVNQKKDSGQKAE